MNVQSCFTGAELFLMPGCAKRDGMEVGDLLDLFKREQGEELADDSLLWSQGR
ncbi:MAG: hypothetical protein GY761_13020 [Hyphomicrobiales bacterium]|nr:hypothetical protein [Hyphomicrobiales bacterium]